MASSSILYMWNKWNIRGFVILSLFLQVFLILFAPLRKKTKNDRIVFLLWLAYLLADWVAAFGIGLISHNEGSLCTHLAEVDRALRVFWASFLLLHLGGPDTITAFSLEDSSLWRRHLLSLTFQVCAVIYVFVQIFPSDKSLVFPTMLIFLAGIIKNVERTLALYLSSLPRLKEWVLSNQDYSALNIEEGVWVQREMDTLDLDGYSHDEEEAKFAENIVMKHAHYFFQISQVFLTSVIFTHKNRRLSQEYFHKVSAIDALRVISIELHFIYELLHTKALIMQFKCSYIFRFIAFIGVAMAFVMFNRLKKHHLSELDVEITYLLLSGGIALDVIAVLMLVFSDWVVAKIQWYKIGSCNNESSLYNLVFAAHYLRKPRFATCEAELKSKVTYAVLNTPLLFRRWSESISACNLLFESLKKSPRKMYKHNWRCGNITFSNICSFQFDKLEKVVSCFQQAVGTIAGICCPRYMDGKRSMIANTKYVSTNPFVEKLWIFIFKEVRRKSEGIIGKAGEELERETREICEAKGDLVLGTLLPENHENDLIFKVVKYREYDESIIILHIATEILYNREDLTARNYEREFSKILSDYMVYLLLNQSNVVSAVAGLAQISMASMLQELQKHITPSTKNVESLCKEISDQPIGTGCPRTLLQWGIILAQKMEGLSDKKWEVISKVWVEKLSYAAVHIKGEAHVQVLSKGGELLAFVWLLMIHFGCYYKPEWGSYYGSPR